MPILYIFIGILLAAAALRVLCLFYYKWYIAWEDKNRHSLLYFGKKLPERRRFKEKIKCHSRILIPFLKMEYSLRKQRFQIPSFEFQGVCGPVNTCSEESFKRARDYSPQVNDIFVAAPMKCGTTWMQQLVYEILSKGRGNLSDNGHVHLNAMSPWLESVDGVSVNEAPLIGPGRHLIKTHLPAQLCPHADHSKFIYITRHPLSCFASITDFFRLMTGFLSPSAGDLAEWFMSDRMWWMPWPDHVSGWWQRAQEKGNVFFTHYEEMKEDLAKVTASLAEFLDMNLNAEEMALVQKRAGFDYMKENEEVFEMTPPNLYSVSGTFFKSGQLQRDRDVPEDLRERIMGFCRGGLKQKAYSGPYFRP